MEWKLMWSNSECGSFQLVEDETAVQQNHFVRGERWIESHCHLAGDRSFPENDQGRLKREAGVVRFLSGRLVDDLSHYPIPTTEGMGGDADPVEKSQSPHQEDRWQRSILLPAAEGSGHGCGESRGHSRLLESP